MDCAWLTIYLAALIVLGIPWALLASRRQARLLAEVVGLVAVFGAGCLGYGLFLLALVGMRPTRYSAGLLAGVALLSLVCLIRGRRASLLQLPPCSLDADPRSRAACFALLALLLLLQGLVTAHALAFRLYEWDAFAVWGLKAKVIAMEGLAPRPAYFTDVSLSYSHLDYPLMLPFLMAGVCGVLGRIDDQLAKLALPVLYLGLGCLVFGFSRRRLPRPMAFALTAVVMGAPVMLGNAGSGYADVPLTAFYTASVLFLLEWAERRDYTACALCGVMSAFAAFTKNEGLALGVINCVGALLLPVRGIPRRLRVAGAGLCTAIFLGLILPWLVWTSDIPRTHESYLTRFRFPQILGQLPRLPTIAAGFLRQIINLDQFGLLWLILILLAAYRWRAFRDVRVQMAWALLLAHLAVYAAVFIVTPWDVDEHLSAALHRLVLHVVPLAGLLIALHCASTARDAIPTAENDSTPVL